MYARGWSWEEPAQTHSHQLHPAHWQGYLASSSDQLPTHTSRAKEKNNESNEYSNRPDMGHGKEKPNKIRCHTRCILGWKMHQKHSRTTFFGWRVHQMHSRDIVGWKGRSKASTKPTVFLVLGFFSISQKGKKEGHLVRFILCKTLKMVKKQMQRPNPCACMPREFLKPMQMWLVPLILS